MGNDTIVNVITFISNANLKGTKIIQVLTITTTTTTTTRNIGKQFYENVLWKVSQNIKKIIFKNNFHIKISGEEKNPQITTLQHINKYSLKGLVHGWRSGKECLAKTNCSGQF
jgi:hypothetical protein